MTENIIQAYLEKSIMSICDDIEARLKKLMEDWKKKAFGLQFFYSIELDNCIIDLTYMRDTYLKAHLQLCRQNKMPKTGFAVKHAEHWMKRLENVESMSFIRVMRLAESWFGFSQTAKDKMNKELCKIAEEVIAGMKEKGELV
ncbi:MAG: hypothetical protein WC341_15745 [Bacteroidales bacterium]|jgi:hypothetical protein